MMTLPEGYQGSRIDISAGCFSTHIDRHYRFISELEVHSEQTPLAAKP
jgi:hypothetical protein